MPRAEAAWEELLACAALEEELGSVLFYGVRPDAFERVVARYGEFLTTLGHQVSVQWLPAAASDDYLWGTGAGLKAPWFSPGALVTPDSDPGVRIVAIDDLSRLSLAAVRALVVLMGAERGHVERWGQQLGFRPRLRWLAACPTQEIGKISQHLLDRFSLRTTVSAGSVNSTRLEQLTQALSANGPGANAASKTDVWSPKLTQSKLKVPDFDPAALSKVVSYGVSLQRQGMRGDLALAHLAKALAKLDAAPVVSTTHVEAAADLFQVPRDTGKEPAQAEPPLVPPAAPLPAPDEDEAAKPVVPLQAAKPSLDQTPQPPAPVYAPAAPPVEPDALSQLAPVTSAITLEREAPVLRDADPLRIPLISGRQNRPGSGEVVGTRPTSTFEDLAITATLFAASPFQALRRKQAGLAPDDKRILLKSDDLRSHRRLPATESLLALLLDYTSLSKSAWGTPLLPFLRSAYKERSRIAVVQVGAQTPKNELCAELLVARNILVPSVATAFDRSPGRASPLAHGLALALELIQRLTNHGRSAIRKVHLVVATDGRGNVPLLASRSGRIEKDVRIGREGVEDALEQARLLGLESRVEAVLLNPGPSALRELPLLLAARMGARVIEIPSLPEEQA